VPDEVQFWGQEIEYKGLRFKLNQHFYVSYMLREDEKHDEGVCYQDPALHAIVRGVRRVVTGAVVSALARPEDKQGDLGFLVDD
jgi:hypothetical protein